MVYHLTIVNGLDEGKRFRVDDEKVVVGRSPSAGVVLHDDSVGWEHLVLRTDGEHLLAQNLSARGTKLKGRRIADEVRLAVHDELELTESCRIRVDSQLGGADRSASMILAVVLVLLLAVGGLALMVISGDGGGAKPKQVTATQRRTAYLRLSERIGIWTDANRFPDEAEVLLIDGWRRESAGDKKMAYKSYATLMSMLLTVSSPVEGDSRTIMELAGPTDQALRAVMGYYTTNEVDFAWDSDASYADALVHFVRWRQKMTKPKVKK